MKLTCCCGASIEVENPLRDLNHTELNGEPQLVEFKRVHAPCLALWREKIEGPRIKPIIWPRLRLNPLFYTLEEMRDRMDANCVIPADAFGRFRDAIRDGRRVFFRDRAGQCISGVVLVEGYDYARRGITPDMYLIEGVDIPTQPTQEWLDKHGVELTGRCEVPHESDYWVCAGMHDDVHGPGRFRLGYNRFAGRRWIVRIKIAHPAERMFGPMSEFTKLNCPIVNEADLSQHAAEHDAIVRKKLLNQVRRAIPTGVIFNGDNHLCTIRYRGDTVAFTGNELTIVICDQSRPVDFSIGQSAIEITKQARDLVQGMGITKKTRYCAFNIVKDQLIWGIK